MTAIAGAVSAPWTSTRGPGVGWWIRSLLSLLVAIGILAVALPVAFGSGSRTATADPLQVFSSGPLVAGDAAGGARLSIAGMVPGQSRAATIRVRNSGSAPSLFSLSARILDRVGAGGAPLSGALVLRIQGAGTAAPLYAGPIGRMPRLDLGSIPAGAARAYRFTVTLPTAAGNEVRGSGLSAGFVWSGA